MASTTGAAPAGVASPSVRSWVKVIFDGPLVAFRLNASQKDVAATAHGAPTNSTIPEPS